jgi:hypothetical protein
VSRGQRGGTPKAVNLGFSRLEPILFLSSSSSFIFTRLSGSRFKHTTTEKNLVAPGNKPGISETAARNSDH